jgi:hypothetical protein
MQKYIEFNEKDIVELKAKLSYDYVKGGFTYNILYNKNGKISLKSGKVASSLNKV